MGLTDTAIEERLVAKTGVRFIDSDEPAVLTRWRGLCITPDEYLSAFKCLWYHAIEREECNMFAAILKHTHRELVDVMPIKLLNQPEMGLQIRTVEFGSGTIDSHVVLLSKDEILALRDYLNTNYPLKY